MSMDDREGVLRSNSQSDAQKKPSPLNPRPLSTDPEHEILNPRLNESGGAWKTRYDQPTLGTVLPLSWLRVWAP